MFSPLCFEPFFAIMSSGWPISLGEGQRRIGKRASEGDNYEDCCDSCELGELGGIDHSLLHGIDLRRHYGLTS